MASGLSAEAFMEVAADPKRYKAMLTEFGERKAAAEDSEAVAKERLSEATRAEERSKGQLESLEAQGREITAAQNALDARTAELDERATEADQRDEAATSRAADLDQRETALTGQRDAALTAIKALLKEDMQQ